MTSEDAVRIWGEVAGLFLVAEHASISGNSFSLKAALVGRRSSWTTISSPDRE